MRVDLEGRRVQRLQLRRHALDPRRGCRRSTSGRRPSPRPTGRAPSGRATRYGLTTVKSPDMFDFTKRLLVRRLDRLATPTDVGDRRGRRDRHHVGVAHARAQRRARAGASQSSVADVVEAIRSPSASIGEQRDRVDRQDALAPQRSVERRVAAALGGEINRGLDGAVADRFHARVGERHGFVRAVRNAAARARHPGSP